MKKLITDYVFNKTAKTITFLEIFKLEQYLLITDVTTNTIIYNFADATKGGTATANTLLLDFDTSALSDTDSLQIFVDIADPNEGNADLLRTLKQIRKTMESLGTVDVANRQRVIVEGAPTTTVTLGTTGGANVTGVGYPVTGNTTGGNPYGLTASQPTQMVATMIDERWSMLDATRNTYGTAIRSKLTFS